MNHSTASAMENISTDIFAKKGNEVLKLVWFKKFWLGESTDELEFSWYGEAVRLPINKFDTKEDAIIHVRSCGYVIQQDERAQQAMGFLNKITKL